MSASRNSVARLEHIRNEIRDLTAATTGATYEDFVASYLLRRTTEHAILIISEASRALPPALIEHYPEAAWVQIKGIGNVLRHDYFSVDTQVLWNILTKHLPILAKVVDTMLRDLAS